MWFCGNTLIPNNVSTFDQEYLRLALYPSHCVFSAVWWLVSYVYAYRSCRHVLMEIVCMLCRLNSVLSIFSYLQAQCSLLYVDCYHLLFCSIPSIVPHSVCKPWKEFTWIKFSTSSSNCCICFFSSLCCIPLQSIHSTQRSVESDNYITTTNKQVYGLVDTNQRVLEGIGK